MIDINMKVQPSFYDDECAIVFSFYFDRAAKKVGEAVVYTCKKTHEHRHTLDNIDTGEHNDPKSGQDKVAYLKEFSIVDEYQASSMKKIQHFLDVIGIENSIGQHHQKKVAY